MLAHIRHKFTRYDELLTETNYASARKAVEPECLKKLIQWRGDEETGRDQLDEILREVVVISDSEDDSDADDGDAEDDDDDGDDEEEEDSESTRDSSAPEPAPGKSREPPIPATNLQELSNQSNPTIATHSRPPNDRSSRPVQKRESRRLAAKAAKRERRAAKRTRGFHRYLEARYNNECAEAAELERKAPGPGESASAATQFRMPQPESGMSHARGAGSSPYASPARDSRFTCEEYQREYLSADGRTSGNERTNNSRPIVGSHANAFEPSYTTRSAVSIRDENLKDCLMQSIEETPPETSHFPYQPTGHHLSHPQHVGQPIPRSAVPVERRDLRNTAPEFHYEESFNGHHVADDRRDLLGARSSHGPDRVHAGSVAYSASHAVSSYPSAPGVVYPVTRPPVPSYQSFIVSSPRIPTIVQDDRLLRRESRPIVIDDGRHTPLLRQDPRLYLVDGRDSQHGHIQGGQYSPVAVDSYGGRPQRGGVLVREPHVAYRERPQVTEHEIIELRRPPVAQPRAHPIPRASPMPMDCTPDAHVDRHMPPELIPVSNVFPRRHEAPAPRDDAYRPPLNPVHIDNRYEVRHGELGIPRYAYHPAPQPSVSRPNPPREEQTAVRFEQVDNRQVSGSPEKLTQTPRSR